MKIKVGFVESNSGVSHVNLDEIFNAEIESLPEIGKPLARLSLDDGRMFGGGEVLRVNHRKNKIYFECKNFRGTTSMFWLERR